MGQSSPPRHVQHPPTASVIKPFGDIGIPALAAAAHVNARRPKEITKARDIPHILRKDRFYD